MQRWTKTLNSIIRIMGDACRLKKQIERPCFMKASYKYKKRLAYKNERLIGDFRNAWVKRAGNVYGIIQKRTLDDRNPLDFVQGFKISYWFYTLWYINPVLIKFRPPVIYKMQCRIKGWNQVNPPEWFSVRLADFSCGRWGYCCPLSAVFFRSLCSSNARPGCLYR